MSVQPRTQSERLDFRLSPEHKALIEQAASAQGQTISSFASAALIKAADEVLQNEAARTLSARDSQKFLYMLSASTHPNAALKAAANRYKRRSGR
jgi:uncharacterized protein (DUF1778 family)